MQLLLIFNININITVELRKLVFYENSWRKRYRWTLQWELLLAVVGLVARNLFVSFCIFFITSVANRVVRNIWSVGRCHTSGIASATGAGTWFRILSPFFFINNDYIFYRQLLHLCQAVPHETWELSARTRLWLGQPRIWEKDFRQWQQIFHFSKASRTDRGNHPPS
jgi:hypothetical protein